MPYFPKKFILTAGPKVTATDVRYVKDAVKNGWNFHHSDYLYKFEEAFAKYIGMDYALAVSCGTSALHLGLHVAGVGPGDEVLVPDMTYVACSNVVHYLGATPILVDIDENTWSIDVEKAKKYITKKTKAIMPVHLYGNVANLDGIYVLAKEHNLTVIDDTCEGFGSLLRGKHIGSYADVSCYSFQGAKLLAIGEGGMFATNNKKWYERARSLYDHGVSATRQLWSEEIGYMYPMSNVQAALGLARLEDIEDLISRKRTIYTWYKKRLNDIEGLMLVPERSEIRSTFWMNSIVMRKDFGVDRETLRKKLKEKKIDTRPFFYPISDFGFYAGPNIPTPVAHAISYNGINLPSGVMLTEETVEYVCQQIRKILLP